MGEAIKYDELQNLHYRNDVLSFKLINPLQKLVFSVFPKSKMSIMGITQSRIQSICTLKMSTIYLLGDM